MAKSGRPRVSVLLFVVLAVTVSLPDTHRATAAFSASELAGFFNKFHIEGATKVLKQVKSGAEAATEVVTVLNDDTDKQSAAGAQGSGSTQLIRNKSYPQLVYVGVTDIKVGDDPTLDHKGSSMLAIQDGSGGVLVSNNFPLTFLNSEAYELLKTKISVGREVTQSKLGDNVEQACYTYKSGTLQPITLVFDGGDEMKVEADKCWYKQGDGSVCLAILKSPWSTGETIIGTMLQAGMNIDGDKMTFQKSNKDGNGSGTSSKSNTAAATKPQHLDRCVQWRRQGGSGRGLGPSYALTNTAICAPNSPFVKQN